MTRTATFIATIILLVGCSGAASVEPQPRDSRLSCAVALMCEGEPIFQFLTQPGLALVQTYVRFDGDLPDDVIFGIEQKFLDGVDNPFHLKGGDWMSFIGVQRNRAVWVAQGTDAMMKGEPGKERTWQIFEWFVVVRRL